MKDIISDHNSHNDKDIKRFAGQLSRLCDVDCNIYDVLSRRIVWPEHFFCLNCKNHEKGACDFIQTHLYGCYQAQRWDSKYIYYCPCGYIFVCACTGGSYTGIVAGPIRMGNPSDILPNELVKDFTTAQVNDLAEIMSMLFCRFDREETFERTEFLNDLYQFAGREYADYPLDMESSLRSAIAAGDKAQSSKLLNILLGYIFFYSSGDLEVIKCRALELLVMLSRSAAEASGDTGRMYILDNDRIQYVQNISSIEQLSIWMSDIINRQIICTFELSEIRHNDTLYKAISYIKENYSSKITLDAVAGHVYLSKSYLSKIFKEEMNCSLTAYVNKIRIEKSKELLNLGDMSLSAIAEAVGFEDQSYFTKVFKAFTGMSPGKYKEKS